MMTPYQLEQAMLVHRVTADGYGLASPTGADGDEIGRHFLALLSEERFRRRAEEFADRHRDHRPQRAVAQLVERIEGALT